mgnify:CR=1 FL=1
MALIDNYAAALKTLDISRMYGDDFFLTWDKTDDEIFGIGLMEMKEMRRQGYDEDFAAALTGATASVGPVFPPSITMLMYASVTGASVGKLFIAGVVPGIMMCVSLMIYVFYYGRVHGLPIGVRYTLKMFLRITFQAFPALLCPVILLVSIYGGIVGVNRELNAEVARGMKPIFLEIVIAPSFTSEALEILSTKKNLRVLEVPMEPLEKTPMQYVGVNGGLLVQRLDTAVETVTGEMCVTKVKPTAAQLADLDFGWRIVKHVKSNAIAVVREGHTIGVGAGQTNRVGSAEIALKQAQAAGFTEGLILASDGFLPFDDTVELAAQYGVSAIVQPGGSIRDADAVAKADELGITMLFTGIRHFKH